MTADYVAKKFGGGTYIQLMRAIKRMTRGKSRNINVLKD